MRRTTWALLIWLMCAPISAQRTPTVHIDPGLDAIVPGEQVFLSTVLSTTEDPLVGKISFELSYPTELLSFVEANPSKGAELSGANIKTEVYNSQDDVGETILRVEVSAPRSIPPGVLLKLTFQVSEEAPTPSQIVVRNVEHSAESVEGEVLETQGINGTVTVISEDSPIFACFFYMH